MSIDIKRAWTDPAYRDTLTAEQLEQLPPCPAGEGALTEADLDKVAGGVAHTGSTGDHGPAPAPTTAGARGACWAQERSRRLGNC